MFVPGHVRTARTLLNPPPYNGISCAGKRRMNVSTISRRRSQKRGALTARRPLRALPVQTVPSDVVETSRSRGQASWHRRFLSNSASITTRQKRLVRAEGIDEWSLGLVSAHRLRVVVYITFGVIVLYALQAWLWRASRPPHTALEYGWSLGSLLWLGAVLPGSLGLAGLLKFRHPRHLDGVKPIDKLVAWRVVSRGTNIAALTATIRRCQVEMSKTPLFPYVIEVVTDAQDVALPPPNKDLRYLAVPAEYRTPNGSLYKARALQYALEHSPLPDDAWVVHLDEETQPTAS